MGLVVLLALAGVIAGAVWAFKHLPWWALLGGAVAIVLAGRWAMKRAFIGLLTVPFKMKGAVLRGAVAEVHSIMPAATPASDVDAESGGAPPRRYYRAEVTVRPTGRSEGGFQLWEPGELRLVKPDSRLNPYDSADEGDDVCDVKRLEVQHESVFQEDEGWKLDGPQRLRMLIAVAPGVSSLKFRYYFEEFGQVRLPAESESGLRPTG